MPLFGGSEGVLLPCNAALGRTCRISLGDDGTHRPRGESECPRPWTFWTDRTMHPVPKRYQAQVRIRGPIRLSLRSEANPRGHAAPALSRALLFVQSSGRPAPAAKQAPAFSMLRVPVRLFRLRLGTRYGKRQIFSTCTKRELGVSDPPGQGFAIARVFPSGSLNQAPFTSPSSATPFSFVLISSVSYCSNETPLEASWSTRPSTSSV
jgi:hypothetical protein